MNYHQFKQWIFNNLWFGENGTPPARRYISALLVSPPVDKVWGVDVSHWNLPPVDLKRMKELYGLSFVIIKGHDGAIKSRYFDEHVAAAKLAGVPWGIYDWLYPSSKVNIDAQTTAWANQYLADPAPLGVFLDAEWTFYSGVQANPTAADLRAAHNSLKAKINRVSTTYTASGYANQYLKGFDWTLEPLWIANYGVTVPSLPVGAPGYDWHQFTNILDGKKLDPNGNAELDGDYFNGTKTEFEIRYGINPTTGATMFYQASGSAIIKQAGNSTAANALLNNQTQYILGPMSGSGAYAGDVLETEAPVNNYVKIKRLWRNGAWTQLPDPAYCIASYLKAITFVPPPDPVSVDLSNLSVHLTHQVDINGNIYSVNNVELVKA